MAKKQNRPMAKILTDSLHGYTLNPKKQHKLTLRRKKKK